MSKTRKETVLEAWKNAIENGYSEWLMTSEPIDIAIDMMDCDADVAAVFDLEFTNLVNVVKTIQEEWEF